MIFALDIFKYIVSSKLLDISNYIDSNLWTNFICYGLLNFMMFYFMLFSVCGRFGYKASKVWITILVNIALFVVSMGLSIARYFIDSATIIFALDGLQFIIIPFLFAKIVYKKETWNTLFNCLATYLTMIGIQLISYTLNNCVIGDIYENGFIMDFVLTIEMYIYIILTYLNANYKEIKKEVKNGNNKEDN